MLQKFREWLVLVLIVLLPFHAFLVTVGTRVIAGPGHAPLPWLAGWKEMVLGVVIIVAIIEVLGECKMQNAKCKIDIFDWLIVGLLVLGFATSIFNFPFLFFHFALGAKYTLFPLFLFLILRRVPWFTLSSSNGSERFLLRTSYFVLLTGIIVAVYGILTLFLPEYFFTWLGYSDLHSLYLPDGPLAAFQKIEGTGIRRIQSTFSGPNQLGVWLLIPWSVAVVGGVRRKLLGYWVIGLLSIALFLTFSRAAWMGAAAILLMSVWWSIPQARKLLGYWFIGLFSVVVFGSMLFPTLFLRTASSRGHWERPVQAIRIIAAHPLGFGLGAAGPASNRTSDVCVFLEEGADVSWASDRPNLCIFRGNQQVQPFDFAQGKSIPCHCPFLPENWYLQVGVELGVMGMVLYLILVGGIGYWLALSFKNNLKFPVLLAFIGISIAALFLHAWEDSAVAYTVWILLAAVLHPPCRSRHSSLS